MNKKRKGSNSQSVVKHLSPGLDVGASSSSSTCPRSSRTKKSADNVDDEIDVNRCCVCFGTFTDDVETSRVQCMCTRHKEYIDDDDVNTELSKLCSLC